MIESDIQRRDRIVGKKLEHICRIRVNRKGSEVLKTKQNKTKKLILEQVEGNEIQSTDRRTFHKEMRILFH